ncbi:MULTISPECIES: cytochrome P450 [unclassified Nocardia]|uniref:cytochrome P450 n=1 Tax=unclassified Nocardia TaxID=2637762 RepID=UPI001CE4B0D3|nr:MULTISPECIES: cytochrome P450 [unclassified Nocardia]
MKAVEMTVTTPSTNRIPPGPNGFRHILGNARALGDNAPEFLAGLHRRYGDMVRLPLGLFTVNIAYHPNAVQHVLQENNGNYVRGIAYEWFKLFMGRGLLTMDGESWRNRRRLVNPLFHKTAIDAMADEMVRSTTVVLDGWAASGGPVIEDVVPDMMRISLGALGRIMFDTDLEPDWPRIGAAMQTVIEAIVFQGTVVQLLPSWLSLPYHRRVARAQAAMFDMAGRIIEVHRSGTHGDRRDLVNLLLNSTDAATGRPLTTENVRDELMTVFIAGHETTGTGLSWALYELARHPEVQERMFAEAQQVFAGRDPVLSDLSRLAYTKAVTDETLRLHPPVYVYPRQALADDEVDGWHIPAGDSLFLCSYATHRHPEFWSTPLQFDPDRFDPTVAADRPKYAYFPFGGGQRKCIGHAMALMQMQLTLAMIVSRFRITAVPGHSAELSTYVTLRPENGVVLRVEPRSR